MPNQSVDWTQCGKLLIYGKKHKQESFFTIGQFLELGWLLVVIWFLPWRFSNQRRWALMWLVSADALHRRAWILICRIYSSNLAGVFLTLYFFFPRIPVGYPWPGFRCVLWVIWSFLGFGMKRISSNWFLQSRSLFLLILWFIFTFFSSFSIVSAFRCLSAWNFRKNLKWNA